MGRSTVVILARYY